jgi:calcineurin-like phosphoesterase family protein
MDNIKLESLYVSSDWHLGESNNDPSKHSYLSNMSEGEKITLCWDLINSIPSNSTFIFLGDAAVTVNDTNLFLSSFWEVEHKNVNMVFIKGDKEGPQQDLMIKKYKWTYADNIVVNIDGIKNLLIHKPVDAMYMIDDGLEVKMVLCGHVHGIWRTQQYKGIPFINCGLDAWCNQLVTGKWIEHQRIAVTKNYYDKNCFINL